MSSISRWFRIAFSPQVSAVLSLFLCARNSSAISRAQKCVRFPRFPRFSRFLKWKTQNFFRSSALCAFLQNWVRHALFSSTKCAWFFTTTILYIFFIKENSHTLGHSKFYWEKWMGNSFKFKDIKNIRIRLYFSYSYL